MQFLPVFEHHLSRETHLQIRPLCSRGRHENARHRPQEFKPGDEVGLYQGFDDRMAIEKQMITSDSDHSKSSEKSTTYS